MKKKKQKKIEKLDIDLFQDVTEEKYKKKKAKYIAEYTEYVPGYSTGLFGWKEGYYEKRPDVGTAKWEEKYPDGYKDWANHQNTLTATGKQLIINKVNELVDIMNNQNNNHD